MDWWNADPDPWSRNWEGEEEPCQEAPPNFALFQWSKAVRDNVSPKLKIGHLIIATGPVSSLFFHCQFPNRKLIGSIILSNISLAGCGVTPGINDPTTTLFTVPEVENTVFVVCQFVVPTTHSQAWTKSLFEHVAPETIHVLETIDEMKVQESLEEGVVTLPMIRILKTDKAPQNEFSPLESLQVVVGLAAGVLSHCQIYGLPATAYLSVESQSYLSVETFTGFETILAHITSKQPQHPNYQKAMLGFKARKINPLFV